LNKSLAVGIIFLFIVSSITPIVFGYNEESSCSSDEENDLYEKPTALSGPMDSPWPMKSHDIHHTGRSPYSTADNQLVEKWRFYLPDCVSGGPIIDKNGTIYFGSEGLGQNFFALYPNGDLKWTYSTNGWIKSTPAIADDGTIYIGSHNPDYYFHAINPDGTEKWTCYVGASISSSPAIADDGTIYFGTMGTGRSRICAINPNGTKKWEYKVGGVITSDPAIADDGTVYIGSQDYYLYAMYPNGTLRWRYKTGNIIYGGPSITDDGTIYVGSLDSYLYTFYPNGTLKWKYDMYGGTWGSPCIGTDGTIYVCSSNLYAINPNGTLIWEFDFGPNRWVGGSSPAISADGTIFVGVRYSDSVGGELIAVNSDGTERWRSDRLCNWLVESSPCIGKDGTVYIGSSFQDGKGYLHAFGSVDSNEPPDTPTIYGTLNGKARETYPYKFSTNDPDNNAIMFYVDWGDGTFTNWTAKAGSGEKVRIDHTYNMRNDYTIRAKAKDVMGAESDWATLEVSMPKSSTIFIPFLNFLENHPHMFPLIRQLLGL
jgi:outer membrane protein assembly factor BamB